MNCLKNNQNTKNVIFCWAYPHVTCYYCFKTNIDSKVLIPSTFALQRRTQIGQLLKMLVAADHYLSPNSDFISRKLYITVLIFNYLSLIVNLHTNFLTRGNQLACIFYTCHCPSTNLNSSCCLRLPKHWWLALVLAVFWKVITNFIKRTILKH